MVVEAHDAKTLTSLQSFLTELFCLALLKCRVFFGRFQGVFSDKKTLHSVDNMLGSCFRLQMQKGNLSSKKKGELAVIESQGFFCRRD